MSGAYSRNKGARGERELAQPGQVFERPQVSVVLREQLAQHRFGQRRVVQTDGDVLGLRIQLFAPTIVDLLFGAPTQGFEQIALATRRR